MDIETARKSADSGNVALAMWWRLSLLGLIGTASMLLAPLERLVPTEMPAMTLRLLAIIQPSILVLALAALGLWAGQRLGLDAPVVRAWAERRSILRVLRPQLLPAAIAGAAAAAVLILFWLGVTAMPGVAEKLGNLQLPLATKLLYGGIVEELMLRWGLMSFFAWAIWRLAGRPAGPPAWCLWTAILFAAILFAAGHLPVLYLLLPNPPPQLLLMVLAGNSVPGMLFGWLFWKRGLEAAMIAHALAHLFSVAALAVL
ncbi:MAG TPA: CPBP family intramembrane glutamic endopeptidase [Allosphingosinicella sp.]|nr:CPBP family intramembrane glutamic endopeptidase [Allosphingosinicella sp.]